ncbi:unnamed protein product [Blepharisma stoltei]|uniref:Uncharacterized protein n=1 Tax=Blepharisma stoltei TaxID=1481888 RepID=A0AAU9I919_9CILI|nr:unnamed protein product [Blepharisma stoltei]
MKTYTSPVSKLKMRVLIEILLINKCLKYKLWVYVLDKNSHIKISYIYNWFFIINIIKIYDGTNFFGIDENSYNILHFFPKEAHYCFEFQF